MLALGLVPTLLRSFLLQRLKAHRYFRLALQPVCLDLASETNPGRYQKQQVRKHHYFIVAAVERLVGAWRQQMWYFALSLGGSPTSFGPPAARSGCAGFPWILAILKVLMSAYASF